MSARVPEQADAYPNVVARLSEACRVIVCPHGIQWIVQRRAKGAIRWRNVGYFRTLRALRARCEKLCPASAVDEALVGLPEHICDRGEAWPEPRFDVERGMVPARSTAAPASAWRACRD